MSGVLHGIIAALKGAVTDTFWKYVTLLLNTSATNGAQNNTFLDSSANAFSITRNGDTTQGSFNPYMPSGYWSGFFDGNGDFIALPNNAAFNLSSNNFTIECWIYPTALIDGTIYRAQVANVTSNAQGFMLAPNGAISFFGYNGGALVVSVASASGAVTVNTWNHVAVVRNGNNTQVYINGTASGTPVTTGYTIGNIPQGPYIGIYQTGVPSLPYQGYISNFRFVNGSAVYTANFTPSTTPLTAISNTSLLCLQDNRFKDNSANAFAITRNGDTRISKFAPLNPPASYSTTSYGGSGYFDGTGDYLTVPSNAAFGLGTGDFTIEMWVYATANPANGPGTLFDLRTTNNASATSTRVDSSRNILFYDGPLNLEINVGTIALNTWTHIAHARASGSLKTYINGTLSNTTAVTSDLGSNQPCMIGNNQTAGYAWNGYISNARIVKGTAVYTANFTPPTTPLTAITNTSLLLNFTNAGIYDATTINDGQTVGNAQVSTTQAKFGTTSMAFDGTGDYLTVIDKPELRLGSGDFTIEGWVYLTATGVAYGLVSKGTATTGWSVNVTSGNKLQFSYTATQLTGATSLASGTWYYFAVVRSGTATGNLKVYLNGSVDATSAGAVTDAFTQTNPLYVGADRVAGAVLNGYLQDARITNGYARTITTPPAAFPTL
jgi:hypothetical protein